MSDGEPPNPGGDAQRIQAKANSNFYFRSDNNPTPHSAETGEDSKPGNDKAFNCPVTVKCILGSIEK